MFFAAVLGILQSSLRPDPADLAKASRAEKGGWIVLHLVGSPYDVGYEHGSLAAAEIDDAIMAESLRFTTDHPHYDWQWLRACAERICWPHLDDEYKQEIQGIADGMRSKGFARDWRDILALNAHIELGDYYLPLYQGGGSAMVSGAPSACSAFVATGSETADGRPVMGHNFWWDYFTGYRWRVMLDVRPAKGHRFILDTLPGMIHSGTDWAMNDAGILICETTISAFSGFKEDGTPEFERMRKAAQYSGSLDDAYETFVKGNNGGYANTWLMADVKTGEIGKLELGLKNIIFHRTKSGYYVGSNFPEDPKLMAEETPGYLATADNNCEMRKKRWILHLDRDKGKVNADLARNYVEDDFDEVTNKRDGGGSSLCGRGPGGGAVNGKVCDAKMADKMEFWARLGIPDGANPEWPGWLPPPMKAHMPPVRPEPWVVIGGD